MSCRVFDTFSPNLHQRCIIGQRWTHHNLGSKVKVTSRYSMLEKAVSRCLCFSRVNSGSIPNAEYLGLAAVGLLQARYPFCYPTNNIETLTCYWNELADLVVKYFCYQFFMANKDFIYLWLKCMQRASIGCYTCLITVTGRDSEKTVRKLFNSLNDLQSHQRSSKIMSVYESGFESIRDREWLWAIFQFEYKSRSTRSQMTFDRWDLLSDHTLLLSWFIVI